MNRIHKSLSQGAERRVLDWICKRMPAWVTSDMLTMLGLFGAALSLIGYHLSGTGRVWLWLAVAGLVLNWLGDSADGSLARYRKTERPQYGFFLDHMTDTLAMALIAIGIGLSPHAMLASGLAVLAAYYTLVVLSMATCIVTDTFQVSFSGVGPTEIRLIIALCTIAAAVLPTPGWICWGQRITIYDLLMIVMTGLMLVTCLVQVLATLKRLAATETRGQGEGGS